MFRSVLLVAVLLIAGSPAHANPFSQTKRLSCCRTDSLPITPACAVCKQTSEKVAPLLVQQPLLLTSAAEDTCLQRPDTVLEPIQGTGLKLPIGPKIPDKITHDLDDVSLKRLEAILSRLQQNQQPVNINLPIADETSQRSSRILMILEWFLYAVGVYFPLSKIGQFLPWVARVAAGLPSALREESRMQQTLPMEQSSTQTKQ